MVVFFPSKSVEEIESETIGIFDLADMPPLLRHSVLNLEYRPFDEDLAEVFDVFQSAGLIGVVDFLLLLDAFVGLPGFLDIVPVPFLIEGVRSKELFLGEDRVGRGDGIEKVLQQSALLGDLARIAGGRIIKRTFFSPSKKLNVVQKGRLLRVLVVLEKIGNSSFSSSYSKERAMEKPPRTVKSSQVSNKTL